MSRSSKLCKLIVQNLTVRCFSQRYFEQHLHLFEGYFQRLVNKSMTEGKYPDSWKIRIDPLCKKPSYETVDCTRPSTDASNFAKVFDSLIYP